MADPDANPANKMRPQMEMARTRKVVRYLGAEFPFQAREITRADWKRVEVDHDAVVWNQANNWRVPLSDLDFLDEDQVRAFIHDDGGFRVEDEALPEEDVPA